MIFILHNYTIISLFILIFPSRFQSLLDVFQERKEDHGDATDQVALYSTGTPHVTDINGPVPVESDHHLVSVWTEAAGIKLKKECRGAGKAAAVLQFSLFQWDSKCLLWDHRAQRKLAVEAPVRATTGSSFRATPTYPLTVEMYCTDLVHHTNCHCKHTHTHTCLYLYRDKYWHTQGLTVTRADIVKSDLWKGFFSLCSYAHGYCQLPPQGSIHME